MMRWVLVLSLLAACNGGGKDQDLDGDGLVGSVDCDDGDASIGGPTTFYEDHDRDGVGSDTSTEDACAAPDGYVETAGDCDDTDLQVKPGAVELCDGVDQDCDGQIDDGATMQTLYADTDGDGYGDADSPLQACAAGEGMVTNRADCDDGDPLVHPGADETCNATDDDCDGKVDEDATDALTWYADDDGDGYGDPAADLTTCDTPGGYVGTADDCDDASAAIHPGATEVCDGEDDDCDGTVDGASSADVYTFYADADGDGYGDPAVTVEDCSAPKGYVSNADDCDDTNKKINPKSAWYADVDGDGYGASSTKVVECAQPSGYIATQGDCDDASAAVNPLAKEVCDGADNDCDGTTDGASASDATTWYADDDGDGYGDATVKGVACDAPPGYVADATDCDDASGAVNPAATEICDAVDDDCDGKTDDADASLSGAPTWYADADADGYGDDGQSATGCDAPTGYVADAGDCDDSNPRIDPAATELCNGWDDDCDGLVDADDPSDAGDATWYADADGDGWGDATTTAVTCARPSGWLETSGDCDDADAAVSPDATEVCGNGIDDDCDGGAGSCALNGTVSLSSADAKVTGTSASLSVGYVIASAGDVDDDGLGDLLISSYTAASFTGETWLVLGSKLSGSSSLSAAQATFTGVALSDESGYALAGPGDVTGDGTADLLVSAINASSKGGVVYVMSGSSSGKTSLSKATTTITGESSSDGLGYALADAGDVDGDGNADFLVGAPMRTTSKTSSNVGEAYLFLGPISTGAISAAKADAGFTGEKSSSYAGYSLAGGQDLDGDGLDDLVVGTQYGTGSKGSVWILTNPSTGTQSLSVADAELTGDTIGDNFGASIASTGDVDGDGYGDLLVGASSDDDGATDAGAAYLAYGPFTADAVLTTTYDAKFLGTSSSEKVGQTVAGPGDVDGDALADLAIGSTAASSSAGAVWLSFGGTASGSVKVTSLDCQLTGETSLDQAATSLAGADINGDGLGDVLVGAIGDDDGGSGAGAGYAVFGTGI